MPNVVWYDTVEGFGLNPHMRNNAVEYEIGIS